MAPWVASLLLLLPQAKIDPSAVDSAVERGAEGLLLRVAGGLPFPVNYNKGTQVFDELVFYALVHAGVDPAHPGYDRLLRHVLSSPLKRTYQVSLIAMALYALDPGKYQDRIAECAQYLVDLQCDNGQWDYGLEIPRPPPPPTRDVATGPGRPSSPAPKPSTQAAPKVPVRRSRRGNAVGDNSNSQYAAMGLRACLRAGCEIEKPVLEKALAWWERSQQEDGSWNYCYQGRIDPAPPGYGSMTAGGVASVVIWRQALGQDVKGAASVRNGLAWIGRNFSTEANPRAPSEGPSWFYYFLYAIERAGDLAGVEKMGAHAWYEEGAGMLLKAQNSGGMWIGRDSDFALSDTSFAILFLRRATKQPPKVATGR